MRIRGGGGGGDSSETHRPDRSGQFALLVLISAVATATLAACGRSETEVIAYVSVDEHAARPVLDLFTERTGVRVRPLIDNEINKTTGLANRLRNERAAPRADLFWSGESVQAGQLARDGVLTVDDAGLAPTMLRARVLVYDPTRVKPEEIPSSWWELAHERYRDRVAMADPRFGSTSGHVAAMHAWCDARGQPEVFTRWAEGLAQNRVKRLSSGNAGVVRAVAAGEVDFGMTDSDDVAAYLAQPGSKPLKTLVLRHGDAKGEGPFLVIGVAAVVTGAPNRTGAEQLLEFLASTEAQTLLASAAPGFHPVSEGERLGLVDGLQFDPAHAEQSLPLALAILLTPDAQ